MQDNEKKPALRFKGFTDPWEQRKLSELTSMHARIGWQNLRTSEFLDSGDYMLITGTDFDDGTVNYSTCHFVERERYEQDKNIQIRNGSILITKDGTLGKVAYVQGLSMPATLNAGVFNVEIRNTSIVDERYLFQYLKAPFLMDYVDKKATGGTIKHLNQNILVDFPVVMPKKTEQVSIGNFFQRIDTLITLHQRKYEKLVNIKKSMLDKMFPKNGASVPEIRFKGFTDPWEQRKLAELTKTITTGKSVNSDEGEVSDGNIGVLKTSCVSYDRFNPSESKPVVKSEQQLVKCAVEKDSVIVSRMNTPERVGACGYVSTDFPNLFLPDRLWKLKFQDTVDTYFVYMMLVSSAYKEKITSMASGTSGSMYNIPKETFLNLQLVIPAKIDEQKQLGKILKKIDTLITLHQRKLEKLQNIKKSCLEKMFV